MSLVLIRHAETDLNAARVLQWPDTPLGERGLAQARAVAARFAGQPPAAILSSDMARARQTAETIAAATGRPVSISPLLGERDFGALRGQRYDQLGHDPIADERAPLGGESMAAFRERVAAAFGWMLAQRRRAEGDLLVVTHGLVIRAILAAHARLPQGAEPPHALANTSVTVLDAEPPHAVRLANCSRHLDPATRDDGRGVTGI